jgi:hypothetical protein
MKSIPSRIVTLCILLLWGVSFSQIARSAPGALGKERKTPADGTSNHFVSERGPHHRVWQKVTREVDDRGQTVLRTNAGYLELAAGLHFKNAKGEWVETKEEFELLPGKAMARQGQHKVTLNYNLNTLGSAEIEMPDGRKLRSHVLGLSYLDVRTGESVLIAAVKDCAGKVSGNQVIYEDAFANFKADVRYTYTRSGFEQDIILREQPPKPTAYGLNPETTRLQVLTEYINPPQPQRRRALTSGGKTPVGDDDLVFGAMRMGQGRAFSLKTNQGKSGVGVAKSWTQLEGRDLLVEEVPVKELEEELKALPQSAGARMKAPQKAGQAASKQIVLPGAPLSQPGTNQMQLAMGPMDSKGVVVDWVLTIDVEETDYRFQTDYTYYISDTVNLRGTTVFEGGTVLKYAQGASLNVEYPATVVMESSEYRPVVFTAKDDDAVGETLAISTGDPTTRFYADPAINYVGGSETNGISLSNFRICHASTAVCANGQLVAVNLRNGQIVRCDRGVYSDGQAVVYVRNVLFARFGTAFSFMNSSAYVENSTFAGIPSGSSYVMVHNLGSQTPITVNAANSVFANITSFCPNPWALVTGHDNGFWRIGGDATFGTPVWVSPTATDPFEERGAGSYYLADSSLFKNKGVDDIDLTLLADLRKRTTVPPQVFMDETISTDQTFAMQATRDTDTLDLGYHYDPLDYVFGGVTANANLKFLQGTAAAWFRTSSGWSGHEGYGLGLADGKTVAFEGRAETPTYWTKYNTAQESVNGAWEGNYGPGGIVGWATTRAAAPKIRAHYLRASMLQDAGGDNHFRDDSGYLDVHTMNCEFSGGSVGGYIPSEYHTNTLFRRTGVWLASGRADSEYRFQNCTFLGREFAINRSVPEPVTVRDCAFDGTSFPNTDPYVGNQSVTYYNFNAFITGQPAIHAPGNADVSVSRFDWRTGPLGGFYLPAESALVNHGSTTADTVGLYHYTVLTNLVNGYQIKETNSTVDIGYHYVATDDNGNPIDTDGNGVPDYLEDCNGDGIPNSHMNRLACVQVGQLADAGTLSFTITNICAGGSISLPILTTNVTFSSGLEQDWVWYDCNTFLNHYETNTVAYTPGPLYFSPAIPSSFPNPGTYTYAALVNGTAPGGICSDIVAAVGTLTINVRGNADADYDGICDCEEVTDGTDPTNSTSVRLERLGYWRFDDTSTWIGEQGQLPLVHPNITGVPSWNTNAVRISVSGAVLSYRDVEANGCRANINLRNGTVRFWFRPEWSSASAGGIGPQTEARLIEVGARGTASGWFGLVIDPSGTNIWFGTQTNLVVRPNSTIYGPGADFWCVSYNTVVGERYSWTKGAFATSVTCGATTLTDSGTFVASSAFAVENGPPMAEYGPFPTCSFLTDLGYLTNLAATISWSISIWHQVVLTYSTEGSALYLDGQLAATGSGVTNYPGDSVRAQGFTIGASADATNQAKGAFDELETFNYALDAALVQSAYQAAINRDSDGDGWPDIVEDLLGTGPYNPTSVPVGITINSPVNGSTIGR